MLITLNRTEAVSCDHNSKQTHRRTFQVFQCHTKRTAKIKIARRKSVKALSAFLNVRAFRKIQESIEQKLLQSREGYSFHYVW